MSTTAKMTSGRLALAEWPEFDQAGWRTAMQPLDLLNSCVGCARRWKDSTRALNVDGYSRFLAWHDQIGGLDLAKAPSERVNKELVTAYWKALQDAELAPHTIAGRLQSLGNMLAAIEPDHDWQWVKRGAYRLQSKATPVHNLAARMQPGEDVLALAMDMMDAADHDRYRTPTDRATLFRDGLLIGVLVLTALRRENLASIRLGKQLTRRGDRMWLSYDPASMKGGERFEFAFPEILVPFLERFVDCHRKVLLNCSKKSLPPNDALWISQHGTHMTSNAIALQVKARTEEAFGVPINPHTFRHMAATAVATSDAGHAHGIKDLLGHSSDRAANKYYNKAKMVDAGRRHQETIDALRRRRLHD